MSESGEHGRKAGSLSAPDFSQEALAQLQIQSDDLALHVQAFLESPDKPGRERLCNDLLRFRNTLVLLDKSGAVFVTEELLALLAADNDDAPVDQNELARVLLLAADQLSNHVALLQRDGTVDSALPLLPLVNDSRACRHETLLSDALVLAAGIDLPHSHLSNPMGQGSDSDEAMRWATQRLAWIDRATASRTVLARKLLRWWGNPDRQELRNDSLESIAQELMSLATFCESHDYLDVLVPLYQAASLIAQAIVDDELSDGPALRSLFAQLERNLHRCVQAESPEDLVPGDLLRNYLYYVAQIEADNAAANELRRRFRLDRVRQASRVNEITSTPTIGVGYHLSRAIRGSIAVETESLRAWLDQAHEQHAEAQPKLIRLRVRLAQLEPVLAMMGAPEALTCLQSINLDLARLDTGQAPVSPVHQGALIESRPASESNESSETDSEEQVRLRLAESLLLLDSLLDRNARKSVRRSASPDPVPAERRDAAYVDMATDICLREGRESLQSIADSLSELLPADALSAGRCHAVTQQLQQLDQVLQVLPLPEVSPLLRGLGEVLTRLQLHGRQNTAATTAGRVAADGSMSAVHEEIATLLVSVDYYLGCVFQPHASASQLLLEAEEALMNARALLDSHADPVPSSGGGQVNERRVAHLLPHMDSLGKALSACRAVPNEQSVAEVGLALRQFLAESKADASPEIKRLAAAVVGWFNKGPCLQHDLDSEQFRLLDEVHAVIPQLIDQWLSNTETVRGFDDLLARLDNTEAALALPDATGLTLDLDDDFLPDALDDVAGHTLDGTLQHVFHHECLGHLDALDAEVRSALQPSAGISQRLPTEQMLRALHTLAGSAQTVDAPSIMAIVQPLQRAALARQREGSTFDAPETRFIGELLGALRARLDALVTGEPEHTEAVAVEQRLPAFLASVIPGSDAAESGLGLASNVRSLDHVFGEEAGELLDRLRLISRNPDCGPDEARAALSVLHTLKGSARMAGRVAIADHAHALEEQLQNLGDPREMAAALKSGYATLNGFVSQASAYMSVATAGGRASGQPGLPRTEESLMVSDSAFDGLLDLATDVTVNQARLSDELARLREVYQDIETIATRWVALPVSEHPSGSSAIQEILSDLEAARLVMRESLHQAEREQQQASRAAAGLQQSLIRTRLVRVDEFRERLAQVVEDACEAAHCQAQVEISGGEVTLDRALYRKLLPPLEHLARNAIMHGIEAENERLVAGKPGTGKVSLVATVDGTDLVVQFIDDGRGIDRNALNVLLMARGEEGVNTHEDLQATLFRSGFSSIPTPTALAGHGLGLSAVQAAVEQMGGRVQLATQAGEGTRISLRIPQRIVVNQVVLVESGGTLFAIPVAHVEAVRMAGVVPDTQERHRRISLSQLLSQQYVTEQSADSPVKAAVLVNVSGQHLALEIDQVIGYRELVTQALGPQMASLRRYAGGSVLADGRQVLILDLSSAVESLGTERRMRSKPARESLRPVALVVDDSMTMRAAAERVLQRSGIAVRQSRDGVEALENLATALPNLIILDIEMPRLDGVGFFKRIREQYGDACPPVIVISSRDDDANRRRMSRLGAVRFLAKPYTESQLQDAIKAAGVHLPDLTIA
ncbi:MAG: response regulator [Granulosicoccus sp.]|nr:response regulator [Granulosicoccus sp.]